MGSPRPPAPMNAAAGQRIGTRKRLVKQQDLRLQKHGAADPDTLLLAAGKLVGVTMRERALQGHQRHELVGALLLLRIGPALQLAKQADVAGDAHMRKQAGPLYRVADTTAKRRQAVVRDGPAERVHGAPVRTLQTVDQLQQRGFTAAALTHQGRRDARGNIQIEIAENDGLPITLRQASEFDDPAHGAVKITLGCRPSAVREGGGNRREHS